MRAAFRSSYVRGTVPWLGFVLLIFIFDRATPPEYNFGFIYLLAIVPAAYYVGRSSGVSIAFASGIAWFLADAAQERLGTLWPSLWNASSRLFVFLLAAILIDLVRRERERLQALDRQRSRFMRVLEHELGPPGRELVDRLRRLEQAGAATAADLRPLVERAEHLEFLSRDFVSLGQLQVGKLWLRHEPVDVRALVEDLRVRSTDGPRMPITLSSGSFVVEGDDPRLRQALGSLLAAARASAGASEVTIDLRRDRGDAKLMISAGAGPFVTAVTDDEAGIGLELARMIVQAHGGRIEHRREAVSKAVRFVVWLPLARV